MEDREYINSLIERSRKAQKAIENYTQEQTDALVRAIGKAIYDNREILAREAVDETRMGTYDSKVRKHTLMAVQWNFMKNKPSVGILDNDPINGIITIAKPMGVIAAIAPSTNPTSTPAVNSMQAVKCRNSVIVAPHPRAQNCTAHAVKLMSDAVAELGAPADLILCIEEPTIEKSGLLMQNADVIVATGGFGMVKAAYSSGKPCYGVGQGNLQVVVDEDYTDINLLVNNILANRTSDYGTACTGEQVIYLPRSRKDEILKAFKDAGAYILDDKAVIDEMRPKMFINGQINRDVVGKTPYEALKAIDVEIDKDSKILMFPLEKHGEEEILCKEIMFPVVRYIIYDKFEDAVAKAKDNLLIEGAGHTSVIYSTNKERIEYIGNVLPVGRMLVCQMGGTAAGNTYANGLDPTLSVGCGSWGNNAISVNLTYKNLMNVTNVSYVIPNAYTPSYEETWG